MRKIISLFLLLALSACSSSQKDEESKQLNITASFYPLTYLSQRIGGKLVKVTQITPNGVEPHDFEPSPQDLAAVQNSKVFIMNGYGIDSWADKIVDDLKNKGVIVVRATNTLNVSGFFDVADENIPDPHVWLDPNYFRKEAEVVRDALIQADPQNTQIYTLNSAGLLSDLLALDQEYRKGLGQCKLNKIITSHNAFRYLAKEYRIESLSIAGFSPEEEPSSKHIAELADLMKKNNIRHVFFETLVGPKLSETLAQETSAETLVLNPIEGLSAQESAKSEDYLVLMQRNLKNLRIAMQCK